MATIQWVNKKLKDGKKERYAYIVENYTVIKNGVKIRKRKILKNLRAVNSKQAQLELARYLDSPSQNDRKITFEEAKSLYSKKLEQKINIEIEQRTFIINMNTSKHLSFFNTQIVNDINYRLIESFKNFLLQYKFSNTYNNMILAELKKILTFCVKNDYLQNLPIIERFRVKMKRKPERLEEKELELLQKIPNKKIASCIQFMLMTGMRPKEARNLKWQDIDFEKKTLNIISQNKNKPGRIIPIYPKLETFLLELKELYFTDTIFVLPYRISQSFNRAMRLEAKKIGVKLNPYALRKTFGSIMAEKNVDRGKLALIMGNSIKIGEDHYINVQHKYLENDMKQIETIF